MKIVAENLTLHEAARLLNDSRALYHPDEGYIRDRDLHGCRFDSMVSKAWKVVKSPLQGPGLYRCKRGAVKLVTPEHPIAGVELVSVGEPVVIKYNWLGVAIGQNIEHWDIIDYVSCFPELSDDLLTVMRIMLLDCIDKCGGVWYMESLGTNRCYEIPRHLWPKYTGPDKYARMKIRLED